MKPAQFRSEYVTPAACAATFELSAGAGRAGVPGAAIGGRCGAACARDSALLNTAAAIMARPRVITLLRSGARLWATPEPENGPARASQGAGRTGPGPTGLGRRAWMLTDGTRN